MIAIRSKIINIARGNTFVQVTWEVKVGKEWMKFDDRIPTDEVTTKMLIYNDFSPYFFTNEAGSLIGKEVLLYLAEETRKPKILEIGTTLEDLAECLGHNEGKTYTYW